MIFFIRFWGERSSWVRFPSPSCCLGNLNPQHSEVWGERGHHSLSFFNRSDQHKWVGSFRPSIYAILCLRSWSCWAKGSCRGAAVKRWFPLSIEVGGAPSPPFRPIIDRDFTDAEGSLLTKPPTWEASRQKEATRKRSCLRSFASPPSPVVVVFGSSLFWFKR